MCKKVLCVILFSIVILAAIPAFAVSDLPFEVEAPAMILMEASSGQILLQKNIDEQFNHAGASKILTAYIITDAIENGEFDMQRNISVSDAAAKAGGMSAFLSPRGEYKAADLYKAMMMISANDATLALVESLNGSQDLFINKMREKASQLGIEPVIENVTGHNANEQKMSVKEAAVVARELLKSALPTKYSSIYMDEFEHAAGRRTEMVNPNKLVRYYNGCDGLMTGSGKTSGYSGIFTAKRGETRYIVVVAGAKNSNSRSAIAQNAFDYAFANYKTAKVAKAGEEIAQDIPVKNGMIKKISGVTSEDVSIIGRKEDLKNIKKELVINEAITAPIKAGDKIGELKIIAGEESLNIPIVASIDVYENTFGLSLNAITRDWVK